MAFLTKAEEAAWKQGVYPALHKKLGAHSADKGINFAVWAPGAQAIHIVGDFNDWDRKAHPMDRHDFGIWEINIPDAVPNQCYKFYITPAEGEAFFKSDPYARHNQGGPDHASVIYPLNKFDWHDGQWLKQRTERHQNNRPLSIYEVHIGSWKKSASGKFLTYRQLAEALVPYVKKMGFTHIELMPVMEHPYLPSWGYQITNYFAPTARYGSPEDFMHLVNACHQNDIGVILDWVPGHFPRDPHGLAFFDGTPLYEHFDSRRRDHPDWKTHNFDLDKPEVRSFLLSNAFFWCEKYHIDALRLDAVASMLYLDYSREDGNWIPNIYDGNEHLGAVTFFQDLNKILHKEFPSVLTIAEESSSWAGVTRPIKQGGLGFDYKWNMGWMNDTLHYFGLSFQKRLKNSHHITFPITYAFDEQFILPLSHDEVVHLKKSLWTKMPGNPSQKFAQLKLLLLYMIGFPGKKLLFMGSELAQKREWSESGQLSWPLLKEKEHLYIQTFLQQLLQFYRSETALYEADNLESGFTWNNLGQKEQGIFSFSRGQNMELLFCFNFSDKNKLCNRGTLQQNSLYYLVFDTSTIKMNTIETPITNFPIHLDPFQGVILKKNSNNF